MIRLPASIYTQTDYQTVVYDICRLQTADSRPQTADRIDKENSINSEVIINNISWAK